MKIETFVARLENGKANNFLYSANGRDGLIVVWKYMGLYIMTWEECLPGKQYDESDYTRDERLEFTNVEEMIAFLRDQGIDPTAFVP